MAEGDPTVLSDRTALICAARGHEQILEPAVRIRMNSNYHDRAYIRVRPRVRNESDHAFVSPVGAYVVVTNPESDTLLTSFHTLFVPSVPANSTRRLRSLSWSGVDLPGFLEWGHRDAHPGECQVEIEIMVMLVLDSDIHVDDSPNNDDCEADNTRFYRYEYMAACPW
jgi:hypothetical protein